MEQETFMENKIVETGQEAMGKFAGEMGIRMDIESIESLDLRRAQASRAWLEAHKKNEDLALRVKDGEQVSHDELTDAANALLHQARMIEAIEGALNLKRNEAKT